MYTEHVSNSGTIFGDLGEEGEKGRMILFNNIESS
jgi:hypothetical protein